MTYIVTNSYKEIYFKGTKEECQKYCRNEGLSHTETWSDGTLEYSTQSRLSIFVNVKRFIQMDRTF